MEIGDILKQRIEDFNKDPKKALKVKGATYQKDWARAVQCFQKRINKDMKKEGKKEFDFMPIRQKLVALKEIDDCRWFYEQCLKYSYTKDKMTGKRNTFSRAFFGALKLRNT